MQPFTPLDLNRKKINLTLTTFFIVKQASLEKKCVPFPPFLEIINQRNSYFMSKNEQWLVRF